MILSRTFPNEARIIDDLDKYREITRPEILKLIENGEPLPDSAEIQDRLTGE